MTKGFYSSNRIEDKLNSILVKPGIPTQPSWLLFLVLVAMLVGGCSTIPRDCRSAVVLPLDPGNQSFEVDLACKCNRSGIRLDEKASYWFEVEAVGFLEDGPIICNPPGYKGVDANCSNPLGPEGYSADELPWWLRMIFWLAAPFRPMNEKNSRWLETVGRVAGDDGDYFSLVKHSSGERAYKPGASGELLVLANDFPWFGRYANNSGALRVTVHRRESIAQALVVSAAHYRQHGDAASLRRVAADLKLGMQRNAVVQLLGPPVYSPTDNQDYYPSELRDENGFTLVLVVNYHAAGTAEAGTIDWFFLDYIGE